MKRLLLIILGAASAAYGQDVYTGASTSGAALGEFGLNTGLRRNLLVYLYGSTGNLNNLASPVFSGNDSELGIRYSQNFERAQWLKIGVQLDVSVGMGWRYKPNNTPILNSGYVSASGILPALRFMVDLTPFVRIEMNTEGAIKLNAFYTYRWSRHFFSLIGAVDLNYLNIGNSEYTVGMAYEYKIMQWVLGTALGLRFSNDVPGTFHVRWDGLLAYNIDGCTLWGRLRYEPRRILLANDHRHEIILQAGFNYNFEFVTAAQRY